jgi:hypothetical protein
LPREARTAVNGTLGSTIRNVASDNRNRQLGVLRLTDATIAQSFSKN